MRLMPILLSFVIGTLCGSLALASANSREVSVANIATHGDSAYSDANRRALRSVIRSELARARRT